MSEYKNKSSYNFTAAGIMMDPKNCLYAPSIHCSYYSCIQYLLHVIYVKLPEIEKNTYLQNVNEEGSSHKHAIMVIERHLLVKAKDDYKTFQSSIKELKKSRVQSDYSETQISQTVGQRAYGLAQSIINILAKNFK